MPVNPEIRINMEVIKKYKPDSFILQQTFKRSRVSYDYLINGVWIADIPKSRPEGTRVVFSEIDSLRTAKDVYFAWQSISNLFVEKPVKPEEALGRIFITRANRVPLFLFSPWGVNPKGSLGEKEITVLEKIGQVGAVLTSRRVQTIQLLMPADTYATEINRIDPQITRNYFEELTIEAEKRGFIVKPWSTIRAENRNTYTKRANELSKNEIQQLLPEWVINSALSAAQRRSGFKTKASIKTAAFAYLRERICEAEIIEAQYRPIKVSAVAKNKDNLVDRDLPRIYIVPEVYKFPWLE